MPAINKPNQHFDVLTWSGTGGGSGATRSITGLNFQPDFVWEKARSSGSGHQLLDSVRGVGQNKVLASNSTSAEPNPANTESLYGWLSSLDSGGFTVTNGTSTFDNWNKSGDTYVGWTWKGGGTAVTNTSGTISSQVSANPTAGFSVVTYTGTGANATVGHGLGVAPSMVIVKDRSNAGNEWAVYHANLTSAAYYIVLNTTAAQALAGAWNSTAPTSSLFTVGGGSVTNQTSHTYVAYCWTSIAGYSQFGSYIGNSSTDGPFVYLGFRPKLVLTKATGTANGTTNSTVWTIWDTSRNTYNAAVSQLYPNSSGVEDTDSAGIDILSNGFKLRRNSEFHNWSGTTYIYAAFAEAPFKFANAR